MSLFIFHNSQRFPIRRIHFCKVSCSGKDTKHAVNLAEDKTGKFWFESNKLHLFKLKEFSSENIESPYSYEYCIIEGFISIIPRYKVMDVWICNNLINKVLKFYITFKFHDNRINTFGFIVG